jgi:thymidine kinase
VRDEEGAQLEGIGRTGGWIEVITGGMFSGKSEELIRRLRRAEIARQPIQVFIPALDTRFDPRRLTSRDNRGYDAIVVESAAALRALVEDDARVIGIDEVQFFDDAIVDVCSELADSNRRVIVAGLDQDYQRRPFGPMPALLAVAELVSKMHAVCVHCGAPAHFSQRLVGGNEQIEVGDDTYEARCRRCYVPFYAHEAAGV